MNERLSVMIGQGGEGRGRLAGDLDCGLWDIDSDLDLEYRKIMKRFYGSVFVAGGLPLDGLVLIPAPFDLLGTVLEDVIDERREADRPG